MFAISRRKVGGTVNGNVQEERGKMCSQILREHTREYTQRRNREKGIFVLPAAFLLVKTIVQENSDDDGSF